MDGHRFDDLARALASQTSRRRFLGGIVATVLGISTIERADAAAGRGPGRSCRNDGNCVAGAHCLTDSRRRKVCLCEEGLQACGNVCIPISSCCRDANCRAFESACARGVCVGGECQTRSRRNGTRCAGGICCNGGCVPCCNGVGNCLECQTSSECPGQDSDCRTRTCVRGVCGFAVAPAGTLTASQTPGDCKKRVCNGSGIAVQVTDDSDLPADYGNQCTAAVCSNGVPAHVPVAAGTPCNQHGGAVCNSSGTCVACLVASDCQGQDTECQVRVCVSGACGFSRTSAGTPLSIQTVGDCKRVECDGLGGTIEVNDDSDVPDDGDPCTLNLCAAGVPSYSRADAGTPCGDGLICDADGACVGCLTASDCPGEDTECQARRCTGGVCDFSFPPSLTPVAHQTVGDCKKNVCDGSGHIVLINDDTDVPADDGNQCTAVICNQGTPARVSSAVGTPCNQSGGAVCDGSGNCVACVVAADCPGQDTECQTRTCIGGACGFANTSAGTPLVVQTGGDCKQDVCDGAGGTAYVVDDTDVPGDDGNQCTENTCIGGVPYPPKPLGTDCNQIPGVICNGAGACVRQALNGTECIADVQCLSWSCVDGYCCNALCTATCFACNLPDNLGSCLPVPGTACNENGGTICNSDGRCVAE